MFGPESKHRVTHVTLGSIYRRARRINMLMHIQKRKNKHARKPMFVKTYYSRLKRYQSITAIRARSRRARQSNAASRRARHYHTSQYHRRIERAVCQLRVSNSETMIHLQYLLDAIEIAFSSS